VKNLLKRRRNGSGLRIVACFLLAALGWISALAQSDGTPEFLRKGRSGDISYPSAGSEFTFIRMIYSGLGGWGYYKSWYTDWPKSDRQFLIGLRRLTSIKAAEREKTIAPTSPEVYRYPFIYSVECGHWNLTDAEVDSLREYLERGGLLFCDDFWGSWEWANFERNLRRVLPGCEIVEIPQDHELFHCYYDIDRLIQVPNVGNGIYDGTTYEQDGYVPYCRGVFNEKGRLMVIINWNTDLGDAWEWADLPGYPAKYSTYAYKIGINAIMYAMTH
jgi:hypothetical protein